MENKNTKIWETRIYICSTCCFNDSEKKEVNALIRKIVDSHKDDLRYIHYEHNQDVGQMVRTVLKWNRKDEEDTLNPVSWFFNQKIIIFFPTYFISFFSYEFSNKFNIHLNR